MNKWAKLAGIVSLIFGNSCNQQPPPQASIGTATDFVDIDLTIDKVETSADGVVTVSARGNLEGAAIGFAVDVFPNWKAQKVDNSDLVVYWGKARLRSLGLESDQFIATLAKLYGSSLATNTMAPQINFTVAGIGDDPRTLQSQPVKMKFFFDSSPEPSHYAEVYLNLDLGAKKLEFHEKDQEYRTPLLRALQEGA